MGTLEDDVSVRQLEWLRHVREAVNLTGPPPSEVLRCLAPPEEDDELSGKTSDNDRPSGACEPVSPVSPKVVEELAGLRWELQERERTVAQLEDLVDLLQTRCRELEDESRELVDLAASKHEHEALEAGVPHERRDEDDYIASIKERQLSREPIPPLGRTSIRSNEHVELERLRARCEDLEEERLNLTAQLERSQPRTRSRSSQSSNESEELLARCERLEAEKEKLQKHVQRLWQMCESLDGAQRSQVRQDSVEELNFEAVLERAVSGRVEERLRRAQEEKAKLEELLETMNSQVRTLEDRLAQAEDASRYEEVMKEKGEVERELGELAGSYAELQGALRAEKQQRAMAEDALQKEREAREAALPDEEVVAPPPQEETRWRSQSEALEREIAKLKDALEEQTLRRCEAEASLSAERLARDEALKRSMESARTSDEAEQELADLREESGKLKEALEEQSRLRSKVEEMEGLRQECAKLKDALEEQTLRRCEAEASLSAERLARDEALKRSMESARTPEAEEPAEARCRALEEEKQELCTQLETYRTMEATRGIQLEGLQEKTEALQNEAAELRARLQESGPDRRALEEEVSQLRKLIEEMAEEKEDGQRSEVEALRVEMASLREQTQHLEAECARRTAQKDELVLQLEEALQDDLRQRLEVAEDAREELTRQLAALEKSDGQVEDMLSSELQKLGQQLQQSQADLASLRQEHSALRSRYDALEADHADLGLRAEEALANQEALSLEHQKVIQEAKELQSRQADPDQGLLNELSKMKGERELLEKQAKQQEKYTETRHADLQAYAEGLRDENKARAEEWKAIVAELSELRGGRNALERRCWDLEHEVKDTEDNLEEQRRLASSWQAESEKLKLELAQLQKAVVDVTKTQQASAEEAERLRTEASELEATRRALQRELAEYRRQQELWSQEQGALEADASRVTAVNEALLEENQTLRSRLEALKPKSDAEEASLNLIAAAEQWVLYHAGMPLAGPSMPYLCGVTVSFQDFQAAVVPLVFASSPQQLRSAAAAVESGALARASLQCVRLCDTQGRGELEVDEVENLLAAVFQRQKLPLPDKDLQRLMFLKFDQEHAGRLSGQDCLCLVDAIFRALLMSPAAVAARMADVEGPVVSPGEGRQFSEAQAQQRLQRRLEEAERAAERALAWQEPVAASLPSGTVRMDASGVKLLDPTRIRQIHP